MLASTLKSTVTTVHFGLRALWDTCQWCKVWVLLFSLAEVSIKFVQYLSSSFDGVSVWPTYKWPKCIHLWVLRLGRSGLN